MSTRSGTASAGYQRRAEAEASPARQEEILGPAAARVLTAIKNRDQYPIA